MSVLRTFPLETGIRSLSGLLVGIWPIVPALSHLQACKEEVPLCHGHRRQGLLCPKNMNIIKASRLDGAQTGAPEYCAYASPSSPRWRQFGLPGLHHRLQLLRQLRASQHLEQPGTNISKVYRQCRGLYSGDLYRQYFRALCLHISSRTHTVP